MISYLLSGWRVYVPDENGQPLYRGRVYFYDASTSEPSAVYQEKEKVTSLGTYVDVDNNGFLPPIWLEANHLYKCVVKRLIQQDPETWQTLWEIDDVGNPFITDDTDDGSSTTMVNDISILRSIDVTSEELPDYVSVAGWSNPGDTGSPMVFRWRAGEVHNEDGHWIKPNSSASLGTWEQILDDEIDPRKFGAIPDTGNAVDSALVNCMRYACEPHVQDVSDHTIYKPRTVKFVRSGTYHLNDAFDFTAYAMIPAFGSAPVPVVIESDVFFDRNITLGKGFTILGNSPVSNGLVITDPQSVAKVSWYGVIPVINNSASRVIVVDKTVNGGSIYLTGRIIINLTDSLPTFNLTDCVLIDAKDGALYPTLLKLGAFLFKHGHNVSPSYDILELKDINGNDVFHVYGNVPYFDNKLNLLDGFKINGSNHLDYINNEWALVLDSISSVKINGYFYGKTMPVINSSFVELDMINYSTVNTGYYDKTLNLEDGQMGYIVLVYETQGGYLVGRVNNLLVNRRIVFSVIGTSGGSVNLPIERWNILVPVMRLGNNFTLGIPRYIETKADGNDTDNSCKISYSVENIT